jgi:hypothetical protein
MKKNDAISPTFCLAKWYMTTLHLDRGISSSCHHCWLVKIDKEQIKKDPSKLTNTDYIIKKRWEMLDGKRPDECNFCWRSEDIGNTSDRTFKSLSIAREESSRGLRDPYEEAVDNWSSVVPSELEISFNNTCNLKCSYCGPQYSSKWEEEIRQHGKYVNDLRYIDPNRILNREYNPYVEAFWKWWPDIKDKLTILRITGGEPLLCKDTYKVMDEIIKGSYSFKFHLNSNMSVDIEPMLARLEKHPNKFTNFVLYASIESGGAKSEYSRYGIDYDLFTSNIEKFLERTNHTLHFMTTVSLLCITGYKDFLEYFIGLGEKYGYERLDISPVIARYPYDMQIALLPDDIKKKVTEELTTLIETDGFSNFQKERHLDLIDQMNLNLDNKIVLRDSFVDFIDEYDRRRGTNFREVYPELSHLLKEWKTIGNST